MFFVGVYRDQRLAETAIDALQRFYQAKILSIADGTHDPGYAAFCAERGVDYRERERVKVPRFAGLWTQRYLEAFLESGEKLLVKIDPDTKVNFGTDFPKSELFCHVQKLHVPNRDFIYHGGAMGFGRLCAKHLVESGFLLDRRYSYGDYAYHRFHGPYLQPGEEDLPDDLVSMQDRIVTEVAGRLGIEALDWEGISQTDLSAPFFHRY